MFWSRVFFSEINLLTEMDHLQLLTCVGSAGEPKTLLDLKGDDLNVWKGREIQILDIKPKTSSNLK